MLENVYRAMCYDHVVSQLTPRRRGGESVFCGRKGAERRYPVDTRVESNSSPEMHVLEMHFEVQVLGCGRQIKYWVS